MTCRSKEQGFNGSLGGPTSAQLHSQTDIASKALSDSSAWAQSSCQASTPTLSSFLHSLTHHPCFAERRSSRGVSEGEDAASVASTSTLASMQDLTAAEDLEYVDPFERCLEALYEKRYSSSRPSLVIPPPCTRCTFRTASC